jgi:hypothetical protein
LSSAGIALGLSLPILSHLDLIPLGYKLGPYWLNHWISWLLFGFIIIYIPIVVILKRGNIKPCGKLIGIHQTGFIIAFILVLPHIGSQLRRVFPLEIGTGLAAYSCGDRKNATELYT